jgi:hypothetical protein
MTDPGPTPHDRLEALRGRFLARAAGWWRVNGDRLEQVAFSAAADMPVEVARGFAEATVSVPLGRSDLGIVRALEAGAPAVSRASELPADSGSGLWLRRFGAVRSVAVPVRDASGTVVRVVSLALAEESPDDNLVAGAIAAEAASWPL